MGVAAVQKGWLDPRTGAFTHPSTDHTLSLAQAIDQGYIIAGTTHTALLIHHRLVL